MSLFRSVKDCFSEKLGIRDLKRQLYDLGKNQENLESRITKLEEKSTEVSRAIATLALAHASLIRDLSDLISQQDKKKTDRRPTTRKTGDDFTN